MPTISTMALLGFTINVLFDMVGIALFVPLILATIKHKKLHTTCHLLIGIYALDSVLSKIVILVPYVLTIRGATISMLSCALAEFIPLFGTFNMFPVMVAIGVDRVLSVYFPLWYINRNDNYYLPVVYATTTPYTLYLIVGIFVNTLRSPYEQIFCNYVVLLGATNWSVASVCTMCFNACVISCYLVIGAKVLYDRWTGGQTPQHHQQSLLKSLALIMAIQVGGWTATIVCYQLLAHIGTVEQQIELSFYVNCFSSMCSTAEVPALYFTSADHRQALRKEFAWFFRFFSKTSIGNSTNVLLVNAATSHVSVQPAAAMRRVSSVNPI